MERYQDLLTKIGDLKVTELAELVKAMEEKFGVSAAMPAAAGVAGGAGAEAEEKTAWDVMLTAGGGVGGDTPRPEKGLGLARAQTVAGEGVGQARLLGARARREGVGGGRGEPAVIDVRGQG